MWKYLFASLLAFLILSEVEFVQSAKNRPYQFKECSSGTVVINFIVDGDPVRKGDAPWIASIYKADRGWEHICGGVVIQYGVVLTAAHCLKELTTTGSKTTNYRVSVGSYRIDTRNLWKIESVVIHPKYGKTKNKHDYDVALIFLKTSKKMPNGTMPACVVDKKTEEEIMKSEMVSCMVYGFGATNEFSPDGSEELVYRRVPIMDNKDCEYNDAFNKETMICLGETRRGAACGGDSGGPLICQDHTTTYFILGIISWGSIICTDKVGVNARVSAHYDWIAKTLRSEGFNFPLKPPPPPQPPSPSEPEAPETTRPTPSMRNPPIPFVPSPTEPPDCLSSTDIQQVNDETRKEIQKKFGAMKGLQVRGQLLAKCAEYRNLSGYECMVACAQNAPNDCLGANYVRDEKICQLLTVARCHLQRDKSLYRVTKFDRRLGVLQ